jgi:membrane protease YdiL (CAAX protease family)
VVSGVPITQVLGLFLIGLLVNGLPKELMSRGLLQRRLEAVTRHSLNTLVLSAWLFNAIHIPSAIDHGTPPLTASLDVFSLLQPTGLAGPAAYGWPIRPRPG